MTIQWHDDAQVFCRWFDKNDVKEQIFEPNSLEKVEKPTTGGAVIGTAERR